MNILEALEAVKQGKVVKYESRHDSIIYILETTLHPVGTKTLNQIDYDVEIDEDKFPQHLSDLTLEELTRVCVEAIYEEKFTSVTFEQMLIEIQEGWKKHKEEQEEEDE